MNRYEKIVFRLAITSRGVATGRGRLVEYKTKKDSWILNQMKKDEIDPNIKIYDDKNIIKFKTNGVTHEFSMY